MKTRKELNTEIEIFIDKFLLDRLQFDSLPITAEQKEFISQYSGWGGVKDSGRSDAGILFEYFTPDALIKKMWAMAYQYSELPIKRVLEPACGTGRFFQYAPAHADMTGYEINRYSAFIARNLYKANVFYGSFESVFFSGYKANAPAIIKNLTKERLLYDLVIGNPPYGKFEGKYAGLGEKTLTKAQSYDEYFITRGLDVLNPKGLLIYVIGAALENGGTMFLDRPDSEVKKQIAGKADLIDAYRLPAGIFEDTDVSTEIIVLRKK